jgi:hypothetical protein
MRFLPPSTSVFDLPQRLNGTVEDGLVRGVDLNGDGRVYTLGCRSETIYKLSDSREGLSFEMTTQNSLARL